MFLLAGAAALDAEAGIFGIRRPDRLDESEPAVTNGLHCGLVVAVNEMNVHSEACDPGVLEQLEIRGQRARPGRCEIEIVAHEVAVGLCGRIVGLEDVHRDSGHARQGCAKKASTPKGSTVSGDERCE